MKKIIFSIVLGLCFAVAQGQTNANRTAKTKIIDALAMLPAPDAQEYNRLMADLASTGSEGVDLLTEMFTDVNDVPVNYALSGWSAYVTEKGKEKERADFANGIIRALQNSTDIEVKAFYIRTLQQVGMNESVAVLSGYIDHESLGDPAIAALVSINSGDSKKAIADAVGSSRGNRIALADAVGQANIEGLSAELKSWITPGDIKLNKAIYYAIANTGTLSDVPLLRNAAASVSYSDDPTHATRSYTALLRKLADDGLTKEAGSEALKFRKKAEAKKAINAAVGAMDIYIYANGKGAMPEVLKAMDNPNRTYRMGVLNSIKPIADKEIYTSLLNKAGQTKVIPAKADIVTFIGESGDPSFSEKIVAMIGNRDHEINIAAMEAATRLGGKEVPAALVNELRKEESPEIIIETAKNSLLSYKGRINDDVAFVLQNGSNDAKIAALSILAARKAEERSEDVIEAASSPNAEIASAAYAALPEVVSGRDIPKLFQMLESSDSEYVPLVQKAITSALMTLPEEKRIGTVTNQMDKAGSKKQLYYIPLAGTGNIKALDIISEAYSGGSTRDKEQALQALLAWNGKEAADYLYEIASTDKSSDALAGYVTVASGSDVTPEMKQIMLTDAMELASSGELKKNILAEAGKLDLFQSLIFSGNFLDDNNSEVRQQAALSVMNIGLGNKSYYGPVVNQLLTKAAGIISGPDSEYQKEAIRKHLSELPQEGGYVSMFNGKDLTGWKGLVENPIARRNMSARDLAERQVKADEIMRNDWVVQDGLLVFVGSGYDNICTDKDYGNFEMYLDWKLYPDGPDADGGVYLRGTPQVQMWDIARTNVGAQVGSGGLYNNQVHRSTPLKVADNDLGKWNTFYIKMIGDRVTVILNGELVTDNVILENFWDRTQPIFPVEQIELQAHGTRVAYRNLYINELPMQEPFVLQDDEVKSGFEVLFDGTNMHKWMGNTQDYIAEDGAIVLYPSNGGGGNLYTKEQFDDFVFRFEFMLTPGANNGLGIRTPPEGDAAYVGMELQILDDDAPIYSQLEEYQYHGSVYGVIPAKRGALKPLGEWNYQEVYAKGNRIKITLNGEVILDGDIEEAAKNGTIDGQDHPGLFNKAGHIAFLGHGSVVKFRNIRVRRL